MIDPLQPNLEKYDKAASTREGDYTYTSIVYSCKVKAQFSTCSPLNADVCHYCVELGAERALTA